MKSIENGPPSVSKSSEDKIQDLRFKIGVANISHHSQMILISNVGS